MALNQPRIDSFTFKITASNGVAYDAHLSLEGDQEAGSQRYLACYFRNESDNTSDFQFLSGPDIVDVSTSTMTDLNLNAAITSINEEIQRVFGAATDGIPTSGYERILWVLKNGLRVTNNVISRI